MRGIALLVGVLVGLACRLRRAASWLPTTEAIPFVVHAPAGRLRGRGARPDADPFCIEFDKTRQNVTELGIVDFLSKEPARVANATPKCFYFQRDHWRASLVQGVPPAIYEWDGSYFFDKARGVGGVYVENFKVGGQTATRR